MHCTLNLGSRVVKRYHSHGTTLDGKHGSHSITTESIPTGVKV